MEKNESQELDKINDLGIVEEPYIRFSKIKIGKIAQIKGGKRLPKAQVSHAKIETIGRQPCAFQNLAYFWS
jgi:hypothetical protein